jgi:ATP-binding cassette subfamily B protein
MLVATNLLMVSIPYLMGKMVGLLEGDPIGVSRLLRLLLIVLGAALAGGLARVVNRLLIFNTGRMIEYELRKALFEHMQRMHSSVFARRPVGDLVSRATNDLGSVRLLFGFGLLHLMNTPILFVMALLVMATTNLRLTRPHWGTSARPPRRISAPPRSSSPTPWKSTRPRRCTA